MIALWLLYATLLGALAAMAAALLERVLRLWRLPVRIAWVLAMTVSLTAPVGVWLRAAPVAAEAPVGGDVTGVSVGPATALALPATMGLAELAAARLGHLADLAAARLAPLDRPLLVTWGLASTLLAALLVHSALRLRRRRREWERREVDGIPVLVAPDTGPAVVGGGRFGVVLPTWALDLDAPLRRLVLRHELEHLRVGDPQLLVAGVAAVVLAPWNPALWWQLGRLRLAVELDCDRRVLQAHGDVERYGLLLMAVGQRAGGLLRLATPALSEPTTTLERRIDAMTARPPRRRLAVALSLAAAAALVAAAACMVPAPDRVAGPNLDPSADRAASRRQADSIAAATGTYLEFQVEKPVEQIDGRVAYPAELRAADVSGQVVAQFVVGTDGLVDTATFRVIHASDPAFVLAVKQALPGMRFTPAEVEGRKVRQLVQQPFVFQIAQPLPTRVGDSAVGAPRGAAVMAPLRLQASAGALTVPEATTQPGSVKADQVHLEFQVERPATQIPGTGTPHYPTMLQAEGIGGTVVAQFVVNTDGTVDTRTFQVIESPHELFTASVRRALADMRFTPAETDGRRVRQLVQQPFVFGVK